MTKKGTADSKGNPKVVAAYLGAAVDEELTL